MGPIWYGLNIALHSKTQHLQAKVFKTTLTLRERARHQRVIQTSQYFS